jgi:hypothetical protein
MMNSLEREREANHEAEGEGADDGKRDRDGGELDISHVADEDVGDGVDPELAQDVESDGPRNLPHLHRLSAEDPPHLPHGPRRRVVPFSLDQWRLHLPALVSELAMRAARTT